MGNLLPEPRHRKWTVRYEYWTLLVLNKASGPLTLGTVYREVSRSLKREKLLREGEDFEWRIRWTLSNAGKKGLAKNAARGEWEITQRGREWVTRDIADLAEW